MVLEGRGVGLVVASLYFLLPFAYLPWLTDDANLLKWVALWVGTAAGLAVLLWRGTRLDRVDLAVGLLVIWAALSLLWSPDRLGAVATFERFATALLAFLVLRRFASPDLAGIAVAAAIAAVIVKATFWPASEVAGFGNANFAAEFLLIALAMLSATQLAGALAVIALYYLFAVADTDIFWPVLALWAVLLLRYASRKGSWVAATVLASGGCAALTVSANLQIAGGTRLDLWIGTFAAFLESPWWGHGIGSFNFVFPFFADAAAPLGIMPFSKEPQVYAWAAHSEPLQLLVELGLVGAALVVGVLWLVIRRGNLIAVTTVGLLSLYGFPLQNPATWLLAAMLGASMCRVGYESHSAGGMPGWAAVRSWWRALRLVGRSGNQCGAGMDQQSPESAPRA